MSNFVFIASIVVKLAASAWIGLLLTAAVIKDPSHAAGVWIATTLCLFVLTLPIEDAKEQ